jgi:hypothetical protein
MSAIGAVSLLVPGPNDLAIWRTRLGIFYFTCNNGTVNTSSDAITGDCKLDTKPQPHWTNNWLGETARDKIYVDWGR